MLKIITRETLLKHFTAIIKTFDAQKILRLSSWLDDLATGAEKLKGESGTWSMSTSRQLFVTKGACTYKLRFNHHRTFKGAIELVKMNGNSDGPTGRPISTAEDAKAFAQNPEWFLPDHPVHELPPVLAPNQVLAIVNAARVLIEAEQAYRDASKTYRDASKSLAQAMAQWDETSSKITANSSVIGRA